MIVRFLVLFLFISWGQAISTSDFHICFTSEREGSNHSNGQTQELLERLYGSESHKMRLGEKVEERKNEEKYEVSDTSGRSKRGKSGVYGAENINHGPRRNQNSAPSLLAGPHFWVSIFILYASLALIFVFPFH